MAQPSAILSLAALFCFAILTLWVPAYWPVAVFQVGVFALAAVAIWRAPPRFSWPFVPLSFAVLWGLFQLLTGRTAYAFETRLATLRWATFLCVFLVGTSLFRDDLMRRQFRLAMVWFAFAVAVFATLQNFISHGAAMGPILYRNHYAVFIEVVLPIALYRGRDSLLYAGMAAVMYASVIASGSRAGTVLATAEVVLVPLLLWTYTGIVRTGILFAIFTSVVGWGFVWNRFWMPDPVGIRRDLIVSTLHMIAAHPWFGTGLGTWPIVYPQYALVDSGAFANQAHCDWLQWTSEGGMLFGIMLVTLFVWSLRPAFRSIWGIGVVAVFLHAMVDYPFSRPALGSWTIVLLAMIAERY